MAPGDETKAAGVAVLEVAIKNLLLENATLELEAVRTGEWANAQDARGSRLAMVDLARRLDGTGLVSEGFATRMLALSCDSVPEWSFPS